MLTFSGVFYGGLALIMSAVYEAGLSYSSLLLELTRDQIIRIAVFVVVLLILWVVMRMILRLTLRLFAFGCGAIVVLGLVLVLMRVFSQ
jgi:hypothetical protein